MSSLNDQEPQKVDVSGSSVPEEHKSRLFDEVIVEYERFMSKQRGIVCSKRATEAHRDEVSSYRDLYASVGIAPEDEGDDSSLIESEVRNFLFPSSMIKREDLVGLVSTFHLPIGHRVLIPRATDRLVGLSFPLPNFIIHVLNLLELAPMQLTPNAYT
ncbi:hypothetical protein ACOSQ2_014486 [Xanthoceras sorbifolium]